LTRKCHSTRKAVPRVREGDATHALTRKKRTTVRFFLSPDGDYFAGAAAVSVLFADLFLLEEFLEEEGLEEECLEEECLEDDL